MDFNVLTVCLGLPIPIVAVSAGIAHENYGINDRWVTSGTALLLVLLIHDATDVGYQRKKVQFGDLLVQCY